MALTLLLLLVVAVSIACVAWGKETCCETTGCYDNNPPFKHLPLPHCEKYINARFFLYTRGNSQDAEILTPESIPAEFSPSRETVFIIHGYTSNARAEWMLAMKEAYLAIADYNVILVGWKKGASSYYYPQSASNTRVTGALAAKVADALVKKGLSRSKIQCVGHSLGSHTCGFFGARTQIQRITALDPAGPKFDSYLPEARLSPDDAKLVDVIHTMGKEGLILDFGTLVPLGHADFYPNGGGVQPGCSNYAASQRNFYKNRSSRDVVAYGDGLGCSHSRAIYYYIESLISPCFPSSMICTDERKLPITCTTCGSDCQQMGFSSQFYTKRGLFYLETNSAAPFCKLS